MGEVLHQVALGCADLDRAIEFYAEKVELTCIARFDPPGLAFFELGPTRLLLERSDSVEPGSSTIYLRVPDLRERYDLLESRGVHFDSEPHHIHTDTAGTFGDPGTQEWMAFFRDPDGNSLALVEVRSASAKG